MGSFTPTTLYEFLGIVGFLIGILVGIKTLRSPKPQDEFVSKIDYDKQQAEIREELKRHTSSRKGIYEKLEEQGKSISRIESTMTQHGQELITLNDTIDKTNERIDAIPQRVISLLRETKNLI